MTISEVNQKVSILCRMLGHRFSEWEYESTNSCEQVRICMRDGYKDSRYSHNLKWENIATNSCEQTLSCERCEYEQDHRTLHAFSKWEYASANSCEQVGICNCGNEENRRTIHEFGEWEYESADSCEQVRICKRDGYKERLQASHEFGKRENTFDARIPTRKICQKCGYEEGEDPFNFMPKWGGGDKPISTCKTCGGHGTYGYGNPCPECGEV